MERESESENVQADAGDKRCEVPSVTGLKSSAARGIGARSSAIVQGAVDPGSFTSHAFALPAQPLGVADSGPSPLSGFNDELHDLESDVYSGAFNDARPGLVTEPFEPALPGWPAHKRIEPY